MENRMSLFRIMLLKLFRIVWSEPGEVIVIEGRSLVQYKNTGDTNRGGCVVSKSKDVIL